MRALSVIPLLLITASLHGAEVRSCRIIHPAGPRQAPEEVFLFDGTASHKVSLCGMNFSDVVSLPAGKITVVLTKDGVPEGGDPPPEAPSAQVPAEWTDIYLVLFKDEGNPVMPVTLVALDAGEARIKPGQTLWMNRTEHRVMGEFGGQVLLIPPGREVIGEPPLATSGYYKALFRYARGEGDVWLPVMEKSWWLDVHSRHLGFILPAGQGLPRIFSFRDYRPAEPR